MNMLLVDRVNKRQSNMVNKLDKSTSRQVNKLLVDRVNKRQSNIVNGRVNK